MKKLTPSNVPVDTNNDHEICPEDLAYLQKYEMNRRDFMMDSLAMGGLAPAARSLCSRTGRRNWHCLIRISSCRGYSSRSWATAMQMLALLLGLGRECRVADLVSWSDRRR